MPTKAVLFTHGGYMPQVRAHQSCIPNLPCASAPSSTKRVQTKPPSPVMKPRLLIVVRHGESEANRNWNVNVSMPNHLVPLTDHGVQQAHVCGQKINELLLPNEKIMLYQSPYCRARQTAGGILEVLTDESNSGKNYKIERLEDPRMREQDFGNFQEREAMQGFLHERQNYGMFFYRIPHGESPADVYDRCSSFCESLFRAFECKAPDVAILVSHGIWGRVFLMRYFRWEYEYFESLCNLPNASPVVLELQEDGKYVLKTQLECWH